MAKSQPNHQTVCRGAGRGVAAIPVAGQGRGARGGLEGGPAPPRESRPSRGPGSSLPHPTLPPPPIFPVQISVDRPLEARPSAAARFLAHVGFPLHLHSPGSPSFTHLVPSRRSARSPPRTSSPTLCHLVTTPTCTGGFLD